MPFAESSQNNLSRPPDGVPAGAPSVRSATDRGMVGQDEAAHAPGDDSPGSGESVSELVLSASIGTN